MYSSQDSVPSPLASILRKSVRRADGSCSVSCGEERGGARLRNCWWHHVQAFTHLTEEAHKLSFSDAIPDF